MVGWLVGWLVGCGERLQLNQRTAVPNSRTLAQAHASAQHTTTTTIPTTTTTTTTAAATATATATAIATATATTAQAAAHMEQHQPLEHQSVHEEEHGAHHQHQDGLLFNGGDCTHTTTGTKWQPTGKQLISHSVNAQKPCCRARSHARTHAPNARTKCTHTSALTSHEKDPVDTVVVPRRTDVVAICTALANKNVSNRMYLLQQ